MHETLEELLHRQPFEPFEVHLSSGETYEIRHPEFGMLLRSKLLIGLPESDRFVVCSLLHVTSVKPVQAA